MGVMFKISKIGRKFGQRVSTESCDPHSPEHLKNPKAIVLSGKSKAIVESHGSEFLQPSLPDISPVNLATISLEEVCLASTPVHWLTLRICMQTSRIVFQATTPDAFLVNILGGTLTLQLKLSEFNFSSRRQSFTVSLF